MADITDTLLELPKPDAEDKDRQFVMALARGLEILRAFEPSAGPLGNKELSARTDIPKPTVSRLTYTLSRLGYLEYIGRLEKYQLGTAVLSVGYSYLQNLDVKALSHPMMQSLADEFDVSLAMGARDRLAMTYLDVVQGAGLATRRLDIGARINISDSAMGMAFLAALPETEKSSLTDALKEKHQDNLTDLEECIARTESEIKSLGFCVVSGKVDKNVIAAAVPFFSPDGGTTLAFNISATRFQYDTAFFYKTLGPRLHEMAGEMQRRLPGHKRW